MTSHMSCGVPYKSIAAKADAICASRVANGSAGVGVPPVDPPASQRAHESLVHNASQANVNETSQKMAREQVAVQPCVTSM